MKVRFNARMIVLLLGALLAACAGLLGLDDVQYKVPVDASAEATTTDGAATDAIADGALDTSDASDAGLDPCTPEDWVQVADAGRVTCGTTSGIDLSNNTSHCGRCNHRCDSTCTSGACDSERWESLTERSLAIGADRQYVYWAVPVPTFGPIHRRSITGDAGSEVFSPGPDGGTPVFGQIVVDDTKVLARSYGYLFAVAKDGSFTHFLATGDWGFIAAEDAGALVTASNPATVQRIALPSTSTNGIGSGETNVTEIVALRGAQRVFWLRPNGAVRIWDDQGGARDLVDAGAENATGLVGDDTGVFWTTSQDGGSGQLWAHRISSGRTELLKTLPELHLRVATTSGLPLGFAALDEKYVYWIPDGDFTVRRTHRCTGDTSVVTSHDVAGDPPWGLAVAGSHVYFATKSGIFRAAK